ncbi:MAG TPA: MFS transporter [Thermomicrobiaceae bacterium]|nr:MFS transporter [Thermomicrobiaceae bacterium]
MGGYTRREQLIILALSLGTFTGVLNVYLLTPFLKLVAAEFHISQSAAGQLATVYALVAGMTGLLTAPLMDRYQRKVLLQLGLLVVALGTALSALAWSFPLMLAARSLAGFGAAFSGGCLFAAASDAFPDLNKRNSCIGILLSATGIAAVVGIPILTQLEALTSWRWAAASLLVPLAVVVAGASVLPDRELGARPSLLADYLARYRLVLRHRETSYLLLANLIRSIVWTAPLVYSVAIWVGLFHVSLRGYSWIFLVAGVTYFAGSNLAPATVRRIGPGGVFVAGSVIQFAAALAFGLATSNLAAAILLVCGLIFFAGAFVSVALNILLQSSLPEIRGAVLSLSNTAGQAGAALGGILGGVILASLSAGALIPVISLLTPLALAAVWLSARGFQPAPLVETAAGD